MAVREVREKPIINVACRRRRGEEIVKLLAERRGIVPLAASPWRSYMNR